MLMYSDITRNRGKINVRRDPFTWQEMDAATISEASKGTIAITLADALADIAKMTCALNIIRDSLAPQKKYEDIMVIINDLFNTKD